MVFLYYSGHARADALSLGAEIMPLAELRESVLTLPATLSIVVLDACQSGAFSRVKGAGPAADFSFNSVQRLNTEGVAVMASSSAAELSQESDELESSYFTHHLLVALRGGGDADRDGRVTLSEAYAYAYNHTLASTATTAVGEQHVTLETDFRGKGDIALTYPAQAKSRLRLGPELEGKILLQKLPTFTVLAELRKAKGHAIELALPAGQYSATIRRSKDALRCALRVQEGATSTLELSGCKLVKEAPARAKGIASHETADEHGDEGFFLELEYGFGAGDRNDDYEARLLSFGFLKEDHDTDRHTVSVGRRLHRNFALGLSYFDLDSATYFRENEQLTQHYRWDTDALGAFAQGDLALGPERLFGGFLRLGGGPTFVSTTYDEIVVDPAFEDTAASVQDLSADVRESEDDYVGYYLTLGAGLYLMPWRYLGFGIEGRYVFAPTLDNDTGETHDVGGTALLLGLRLRTWE
jgi:hypothetical protein